MGRSQGEVAAVFEAPDGAPPSNRDLLIWPRAPDAPPYRVSELNEHVDPLVYSLLFPHGDLGWCDQLKHCEEHRTATYQRHRLMVRLSSGV